MEAVRIRQPFRVAFGKPTPVGLVVVTPIAGAFDFVAAFMNDPPHGGLRLIANRDVASHATAGVVWWIRWRNCDPLHGAYRILRPQTQVPDRAPRIAGGPAPQIVGVVEEVRLVSVVKCRPKGEDNVVADLLSVSQEFAGIPEWLMIVAREHQEPGSRHPVSRPHFAIVPDLIEQVAAEIVYPEDTLRI